MADPTPEDVAEAIATRLQTLDPEGFGSLSDELRQRIADRMFLALAEQIVATAGGAAAVTSVDGRIGAVTLADLYATRAHQLSNANPHGVTANQAGAVALPVGVTAGSVATADGSGSVIWTAPPELQRVILDAAHGEATIPAASTSVVVLHGLVGAPQPGQIQISLGGDLGAANAVWIESMDEVELEIRADVAPGVDVPVHWSALIVGSPTPLEPDEIEGLAYWFDASTLALSDGDPVAIWPDLSGHGRNLVQATGGSQPTWRANVAGDLPVVRFDGTSDSMQFIGANPADLLNQPLTIVMVFSAGAGAGAIALDGSDTFNRCLIGAGSTLEQHLRMWAGAGATSGPSWGTRPRPFGVYSAEFKAAQTTARYNGMPVATSNSGTNSLQGLTLMARFNMVRHMGGDVGEVLVYDRGLTLVELQRLEAHLKGKWGI